MASQNKNCPVSSNLHIPEPHSPAFAVKCVSEPVKIIFSGIAESAQKSFRGGKFAPLGWRKPHGGDAVAMNI